MTRASGGAVKVIGNGKLITRAVSVAQGLYRSVMAVPIPPHEGLNTEHQDILGEVDMGFYAYLKRTFRILKQVREEGSQLKQ